jgi:hypothetical protein
MTAPPSRSRPLTRADLMSLETYSVERKAFRAAAIAHKRRRTIALGDHVTLLFEDRLTVQYQVQEMLRIERIFEAAAIQEELDAYNPLIPDGRNLKATLLIEYPDPAERALKLAELRGIEDRVYVQVADASRRFAHADEDLDRSNDSKTSAVHFLRFELDDGDRAALRSGAALAFGIDDPRLPLHVGIAEPQRAILIADLEH